MQREIKTYMRVSLGAEVNRGIMYIARQRPPIRGRQAGRVLFCMRSLSYGIFYLYRRYAAPLMEELPPMHINLLTFPVLSISTTHCTLYCIFGTSQGAKIKVARVYRAFYFTELPVYT